MTFHYIDDNEMLLEIFEALFTSDHKSVQTFSCPLKYLAYMNSPQYKVPAAVLTDIQMPVMNGYELIDIIRERFPNQKFITLSGLPEIPQGGHKSACMHIHKPLELKQ